MLASVVDGCVSESMSEREDEEGAMDAQDSGINLITAREQFAHCQRLTDLLLQIQHIQREMTVLDSQLQMLYKQPPGEALQEITNQKIIDYQAKLQEWDRLIGLLGNHKGNQGMNGC
ncbi:uncharacterized protein LOC129958597 isoform X1 [Argiope bruennichi]|uniref:uncharacterized protein LOC129958597 isoform X1 n=1 Tax=Argiope bruennichi TaxID=94029 RepID=UPI00249586D8|nr:uncharacterized protein LOC129958597 isoform X1 [Argiope bruennichi]